MKSGVAISPDILGDAGYQIEQTDEYDGNYRKVILHGPLVLPALERPDYRGLIYYHLDQSDYRKLFRYCVEHQQLDIIEELTDFYPHDVFVGVVRIFLMGTSVYFAAAAVVGFFFALYSPVFQITRLIFPVIRVGLSAFFFYLYRKFW